MLTAALRAGRQVAVLFCDVDHFKVVNDLLGLGRGPHPACERAVHRGPRPPRCHLRAALLTGTLHTPQRQRP